MNKGNIHLSCNLLKFTFFSFLWVLSLVMLAGSYSFAAQNVSRFFDATNPVSLLDALVDKANEDGRIQNTSMDGVTSLAAGESWNLSMRITNTLMWISKNIYPYIQWICFFGFILAIILLIYNGFLMVTNALHNGGKLEKVQKNFVSIGIGVVILVGFYFLLDIIVAVINLFA